MPCDLMLIKNEVCFIDSYMKSNRKILNRCAEHWLKSNKWLTYMEKIFFQSISKVHVDEQLWSMFEDLIGAI